MERAKSVETEAHQDLFELRFDHLAVGGSAIILLLAALALRWMLRKHRRTRKARQRNRRRRRRSDSDASAERGRHRSDSDGSPRRGRRNRGGSCSCQQRVMPWMPPIPMNFLQPWMQPATLPHQDWKQETRAPSPRFIELSELARTPAKGPAITAPEPSAPPASRALPSPTRRLPQETQQTA